MPTAQSAQRNFLIPLGSTIELNQAPPTGKKTLVNTIKQKDGVVKQPPEFPWTVDLGTPHLRTNWNIQSVGVSFKASCIRTTSSLKKIANERNLTFALELLVGNTVLAIIYVKFKLPKVESTKEEIQEWFFLLEELKLYSFELFSLATVNGGEQLSFRLTCQEGYTFTVLENSFTVFFEEINLNLLFEQLFPNRQNVSR